LNKLEDETVFACSACFKDRGLQLDAEKIGFDAVGDCPACGSKRGCKLTKAKLDELAYRFFVWGSLHRYDYGAAPAIQFNQHQATSIKFSPALGEDIKLFEKALVGVMHF